MKPMVEVNIQDIANEAVRVGLKRRYVPGTGAV
jgi:hypothetical protein